MIRENPLHTHKQFCYLTSGVDGLFGKVTANWLKLIKFMMLHLKRKLDKKVSFSNRLLITDC